MLLVLGMFIFVWQKTPAEIRLPSPSVAPFHFPFQPEGVDEFWTEVQESVVYLKASFFFFFFLKLLILFPDNHRRGKEKETLAFIQMKNNSKKITMFTCAYCYCGYPEYFRHVAKRHSCFLAMALTACVQIAFYFLPASAEYRLYQPTSTFLLLSWNFHCTYSIWCLSFNCYQQ